MSTTVLCRSKCKSAMRVHSEWALALALEIYNYTRTREREREKKKKELPRVNYNVICAKAH